MASKSLIQKSLAIPLAKSFDQKLTDESSEEYKELADDVTELVRPTFEANNPIPGSDFEIHVRFFSSNTIQTKRQEVMKLLSTACSNIAIYRYE